MRANSITKTINVCRKLLLLDVLQQRTGQSSRGYVRKRRGGEIHFIPSALSRPVRCSVPTGKEIHRDQKTGTAERRYTLPLPRCAISSAPSPSPREFLGIPRLVTGGGDRVRFAISPASTNTTTGGATRQPTPNPHEYLVIVEAQKLLVIRARKGRGVGVSSVPNAEATPDPHPLCTRPVVEYLDMSTTSADIYSNNQDFGMSRQGAKTKRRSPID